MKEVKIGLRERLEAVEDEFVDLWNNMANLWETDCVSVSALVNAQYPSIAGTWDCICMAV